MAVEFGTDGVRGVANRELTPEVALAIGRATARVLGQGGARPEVLIGRDTRRSGPMLFAAVAAGVCAEGGTAVDLGVVPTPAVAHACGTRSVPGVMISASHNPFADNGIKLFGSGGLKLDDATQTQVQRTLNDLLDLGPDAGAPVGDGIGVLRIDVSAAGAYMERLLETLEGRRLDGLHVVVDCANGSNSEIGPEVFRWLGAEVTAIACSPDGVNINDGCGSTHPERLQAEVVARGASVGIAFDGDADRVLAVDERGSLIDGDQIMALLATDLRDRGRLSGDTVAVTVMSNLGFRQAMEAAGISVVETKVGDRYVLEAIEAGGLSLGGEQSGHIILRDLSPTGDGLLGAIALLDLVYRHGRPLSELAGAAMIRLPQVLRNLRTTSPAAEVVDRLGDVMAEATARLGGRGRILVRASGTEPLVRVMAEAPTEREAADVVDELLEAARAVDGPG